MNSRAQKKEISTAGVPLLLEPVPIFFREEAGVRSEGGEGVYIATQYSIVLIFLTQNCGMRVRSVRRTTLKVFTRQTFLIA